MSNKLSQKSEITPDPAKPEQINTAITPDEDEGTEKKNAKFTQAIAIAKSNRIDDLEKAIEILEELDGWNDSRKTLVSYREKRLELVNENNRRAETAVLAINVAAKKNRRISIIITVVMIASVLAIAINAYLTYQKEHPHTAPEGVIEESM